MYKTFLQISIENQAAETTDKLTISINENSREHNNRSLQQETSDLNDADKANLSLEPTLSSCFGDGSFAKLKASSEPAEKPKIVVTCRVIQANAIIFPKAKSGIFDGASDSGKFKDQADVSNLISSTFLIIIFINCI